MTDTELIEKARAVWEAGMDLNSVEGVDAIYAALKEIAEEAVRVAPVDDEEVREALESADSRINCSGSISTAEVLAHALRTKTSALEAEHEISLTYHRQNMELAARNVELLKALKEEEKNVKGWNDQYLELVDKIAAVKALGIVEVDAALEKK